MKRSEIHVGDVLALQSSKYDVPARAEILDLGPWVTLRAPSYSWKAVPPETLTLADGSVVQAAARPPKQYDSAGDKGVLARVTRKAPSHSASKDDQVTVEAVRLNALRGRYDDVMGARAADRAAADAARAADQAEARQRAEAIAALNERAQQVIGDERTVVEGSHGDREAILSVADLDTLLALAYLGAQHRPV